MKTHEEMYEQVITRRNADRATRKKRRGAIIGISVIIVAVICVFPALMQKVGKSAMSDGIKSYGGTIQDYDSYNYSYDAASGGYYSEKNNSGISAKSNTGTAELLTSSRKIIEYVNLSVETKTFDKLIDDINAAVKQSGGYIEGSEVRGNSYYGAYSRTAEIKIRIPKTKQTDFSDFMAKNSNIVRRTVSTEDVTDRYIDTQSRIKALTLEKETLEKLLTQSDNVADTLTVYEKLTEVIAEIESYQGKLNQMDNLIDYTTFTVYIDEVERETNIEKQGWFSKTKDALLNNFSNLGTGLLNFLSFVIASLPYLILLAVIAVVVVLIIRRIKKKKAKKYEQELLEEQF
ncbi:MAG: DUF4349 domain-containing protein [Clostridiales bacterium]|nr:DUF4349 domain-containing protein [Clostridiales bacterium]